MDSQTLESAERAALEARIARRYPLRIERLVFGRVELDISSVADPDRVLLDMERGIQVSSSDDPRWQPYWARAWESAIAVGRTIAARDLSDLYVLDVGCGVGVGGTVAAACGATVVMADAAPAALLFARLNAWPWRSRVRALRLDWRKDRLPGPKFDLILGADILYDRGDWPFLNDFWRHHLSQDGELILAEPSRSISDGFVPWMQSRDWRIDESAVEVVGHVRPLRLYVGRAR